jgi:23S rRNA (pseudouridine1915-N3)-methyltransferase
MKILIAMPSRSAKDPMLLQALEYLDHSRPPFRSTALFLNTKQEEDPNKRKELEAQSLLKSTEGFYRVALAEDGRRMNSLDFTNHVAKLVSSQKVAFIIGGAFGLSPELIKECQSSLSMSSMTLPHRLAFLLLSEQIFRASEIWQNTSYHK